MLNEKLNAVMKGITKSDLGSAVLQPQKAAKFVQDLSAQNVMLADARRIDMSSFIRDIDRIGYAGTMLEKGVEGTAPSAESKPTIATNQLVAQELVGYVTLFDATVEDNIEKAGFEDTIVTLLADRAGADMEELFINGDKTSSDALLKATDGWLIKAGNKVDGGAETPDFDPTDVEAMFEAMLLGLAAKYKRNKKNLKFYVSDKIENDYRNALKTRNSVLGDAAQATADKLAYKGIVVEFVPAMADGSALLTATDNLVYGIYRDIKVEQERSAKTRATDVVVSARVDCHFENEDAAVVAVGYTG